VKSLADHQELKAHLGYKALWYDIPFILALYCIVSSTSTLHTPLVVVVMKYN